MTTPIDAKVQSGVAAILAQPANNNPHRQSFAAAYLSEDGCKLYSRIDYRTAAEYLPAMVRRAVLAR